MAVKKKMHIKMKSTESHYFYVSRKNSVSKKNPKNQQKLVLRKYDPVLRKHVEFKEASLK